MNNCSCVLKDDTWTGKKAPAYEEEKSVEIKLKWGALKLAFENKINSLIKKVEAKFDLDKDEAPYYGRYDGLYCANQILFSPLHDHIPMGGKVVHLIEKRYLFDVVTNVTDYLAMSHQGGYRTLNDFKTNPAYRQALISGLDMAIQAFEDSFEKKNIVVWVMQYYLKSHMVNYGLEYADVNSSFNPSRVNYWRNEIIKYLSQFLVPSLEYKRISYKWNPELLKVDQNLIETLNLYEGMKVKVRLSGQDTIPSSKGLFVTEEMKQLCAKGSHYTVSKLYKHICNIANGGCYFYSQHEAVVFKEISQVWPIKFFDLDPV